MIADAIYVSDEFTTKRKDAATKAMQAMFAGVEYWRKNATEANEIIAKKTGFSVEDVAGILGGENNPEDGTMYMYNLTEAAQFCGVKEGNPPFNQTNGQIKEHWEITNKWWIRFGLMKETVAPENGIDCSLIEAALK